MTIINISERNQMPDQTPYRNLSRHQYGTLKFIKENHVTLTYLRHAHAGTLYSVISNGWVARHGTGDKAEITLTKAGEDTLRIYTEASINERKSEADLTDRCQRLLAHSRRLSVAS